MASVGVCPLSEAHLPNVEIPSGVFRSILLGCHEGVVVVDARREIIFWNQGAVDIFGYTPQEAIGCEIHSLITPESDRERANDAYDRFIRTGEGRLLGSKVELRAVTKSGEDIWIELGINAVMVGGKRAAFAVIRETSERRQREAELSRQAQTDPLSGIYNRRALLSTLDGAEDASVTVIILDLDDFKAINDKLGHAAGDRAICLVANRLREVYRDALAVGRLGGDEFCVIMPETGRDELLTRFDTLLTLVQQDGFSQLAGRRLGLSAGAASGIVDRYRSRELLGAADHALYRSKLAGKNRLSTAMFEDGLAALGGRQRY